MHLTNQLEVTSTCHKEHEDMFHKPHSNISSKLLQDLLELKRIWHELIHKGQTTLDLALRTLHLQDLRRWEPKVQESFADKYGTAPLSYLAIAPTNFSDFMGP